MSSSDRSNAAAASARYHAISPSSSARCPCPAHGPAPSIFYNVDGFARLAAQAHDAIDQYVPFVSSGLMLSWPISDIHSLSFRASSSICNRRPPSRPGTPPLPIKWRGKGRFLPFFCSLPHIAIQAYRRPQQKTSTGTSGTGHTPPRQLLPFFRAGAALNRRQTLNTERLPCSTSYFLAQLPCADSAQADTNSSSAAAVSAVTPPARSAAELTSRAHIPRDAAVTHGGRFDLLILFRLL